jgi:hypothetical protein
MSTFDKTVTINAPPNIVRAAIRRMYPVVTEDINLIYFFDEDNTLWNVFYWQPEGEDQTYLRFIVTLKPNIRSRLLNARNLIRALDQLEQTIPFEASEQAYERLETLKQIGSTFPTLPETPKPEIPRLSNLFTPYPETWIILLLIGLGALVPWLLCRMSGGM